jgi:glycogen synthase
MAKKKLLSPDYIFETSWEVCNKVGGIYTVLSTRAKTLQDEHLDKLFFIGPDFWKENESPFFKEDKKLLKDWKEKAISMGLSVRVGRWIIPGSPIAILVDFKPFQNSEILNQAYYSVWEHFRVDSMLAYGDYDEAAAFGIAAGKVMESLYNHIIKVEKKAKVVAHFNEWMTAFGLFYIKRKLPKVATIFTTHATTIGRSIAGNGKPLYDHLSAYNGDQMARELNVVAKHSVEKAVAHYCDAFTTVSDITAKECEQLLDRKVDLVTPNGFENGFVPSTEVAFEKKRKQARKILTSVTEKLIGYKVSKDAIFVGTCGRYEYKNKGIDVFIDSLNCLAKKDKLEREVIGFVCVPAYIKGPRLDLQDVLKQKNQTSGLPFNFLTHELYEPYNDNVSNAIRWFGLENKPEDKVKIVFIPSYLNGNDGIFNKDYYDLLIGFDLTIYPSYYEPWGYTPLESIAFSIPTITTNLSGFGQWVNAEKDEKKSGVYVISRTDYNYHEVKEQIANTILEFVNLQENEVEMKRNSAKSLSLQALWQNFISYYKEAYHFALMKKKF